MAFTKPHKTIRVCYLPIRMSEVGRGRPGAINSEYSMGKVIGRRE